jgi:hypothetical protein
MKGIHLEGTDIVVFGGTKEEGKSYLMKHLAKGLKNRIIWDYNREHGDMGYIIYYIEDLMPALERGLTHIVFQPIDKSPSGFNAFLHECNQMSQYYSFVLIIEEVEVYAEPSRLNLYKHFPDLADLLDNGRHRNIGVWCLCRNAHVLARKITFSADHIFAFRMHRPQDVEYMEEWIGPQANMLSMAKVESWNRRHPDGKINLIDEYHFLHFNKVKTVVRSPV